MGGDTNNARDVFVRDLAGKTTERVSVSSTGAQTAPVGRDSTGPSISGDGRYVAFQSEANNLVGDDPNFGVDVFIRDRTAATTERIGPFVSQVGMDISFIQGGSDPSINADGRYVAYENSGEDADGVPGRHVYLHDRVADTTVRVSCAPNGDRGNGPSSRSSISADGRYVAFVSDATNLVNGDTSIEDVFRWDRQTGVIQRISVSTGGVGGNNDSRSASIGGDGLHVAFGSWATNLVAGDTNGASDVFIRNLG